MATVIEERVETPAVRQARQRPAVRSAPRPVELPARHWGPADRTAGGLTVFAGLVSLVLLAVFALDLAIGVPFRQASLVMDWGFVVCSAVLAYLSWSTWRELK